VTVLVDTSIWIRFLAGREPWRKHLDDLLAVEEVVGHPLVEGELVVGDNGGRSRLLRDYALMGRVAPVPHEEVVAFVRRRSLAARGLRWIDAHLLASALVARVELWSADGAVVDAARAQHRTR
jgi:predicted nucleic acid-binding protein